MAQQWLPTGCDCVKRNKRISIYGELQLACQASQNLVAVIFVFCDFTIRILFIAKYIYIYEEFDVVFRCIAKTHERK